MAQQIGAVLPTPQRQPSADVETSSKPLATSLTPNLRAEAEETAHSLEVTARLGWKDFLTDGDRRRAREHLPALEAMLAPVTAKEFAVAMDPLLEFIEIFRLPQAEEVSATKIYRMALADLPADLLVLAIQRTIANHKYHVIPKPGDIRERVTEELEARKRAVRLAKMAAK